jgi:hypothetical protein
LRWIRLAKPIIDVSSGGKVLTTFLILEKTMVFDD